MQLVPESTSSARSPKQSGPYAHNSIGTLSRSALSAAAFAPSSLCCGCTAVACALCSETCRLRERTQRTTPSRADRRAKTSREPGSFEVSKAGERQGPCKPEATAAALVPFVAVKPPCERHSVWVMREVLRSKPVISLVFDDMKMEVNAPEDVEVDGHGRIRCK